MSSIIGVGFFILMISAGFFVLLFAARLGDEWTRIKVQLTGPVSRPAMIHTFGASLAEGYLAGFDRSVLGVQLFNVVVTTPRLLYAAFALVFVIVNLLVTGS